MELRDRLKAARLALGETQAEFAARLEVPQGLYNRWETGVRNPSWAAKALIKRVLDDIGRQAMEGQSGKRVDRR